MRYCSPTVHDKKEQGRKDDIWSLIYMLIELHCGLPWQKEKDKKRLELTKMNISDEALLKNFPVEMHPILPHLRTLNCYNRPNYSMIHKCFLRLIKRLGIKYNDKFDWETDAQVEDLVRCISFIRLRTKVPEYEHAEEFFQSDPIRVSGAPPKWMDTKGGRTVEDLEEMMNKPLDIDRTRSSSKNSRRKSSKSSAIKK
ncbi:unnamed protein product [Anisakis simplex]|uniref:Protein kinase domain-containing protein n=1 Tax=Anisakis simplex TaxID=6269 RepID=A0A0M3J4S7_ANISI|nr:unnamed protein product [Anisakis simplex]